MGRGLEQSETVMIRRFAVAGALFQVLRQGYPIRSILRGAYSTLPRLLAGLRCEGYDRYTYEPPDPGCLL